jgi:hypothetical protein
MTYPWGHMTTLFPCLVPNAPPLHDQTLCLFRDLPPGVHNFQVHFGMFARFLANLTYPRGHMTLLLFCLALYHMHYFHLLTS